MNILMKCGHTANATYGEDNKPCCAICIPNKEAFEPADQPSLEERTAKCSDCDKETRSSTDLPFFEYRPDRPHDSYYCGCRGWE